MARVSFRKRKMRCDGNDPCATCRTTSSSCVYTAGAKFSRSNNSDEEDFSGRQATESVSMAGESSPSFILSQPRLENESSNVVDLGFLQDLNQIQFASATDGEVSIRVSTEEGASNELNLPISSEDVFHSFMDPSIMNDIWRMPAVLRTPHSLYDISWSG
jgi:hypothetical protein